MSTSTSDADSSSAGFGPRVLSARAHAVLGGLRRSRSLAILRGDDPDALADAGCTVIAAGLGVLEVSLTSRDAVSVIRTIRDRAPSATVGAGTVVTVGDAKAAVDAGADFIVTPGLGPAVAACTAADVPVVVGALTPSEIIAATELGATAIKLFPASLGGPEYLQALRAPFPEVAFVPVGGVSIEQSDRYLRAGAVAVGLGSPLLGDGAMTDGSHEDLTNRVRRLLAVVQ